MLDSTAKAHAGQWKHDGDLHTVQLVFDKEGGHHLECAYTDLAGNPARRAVREFVLDQTAPVILIQGVRDGSANRGEILPVVTVSDAHIEQQGVSIAVRAGTGAPVDNLIETEVFEDEANTKCRFTLKDMTDKEDNVYYLTVTAADQAGNQTARTAVFHSTGKALYTT